MTHNAADHRTEEECPTSQRVDGKIHTWLFDGDDPYVKCCWCGKVQDAITGLDLSEGNDKSVVTLHMTKEFYDADIAKARQEERQSVSDHSLLAKLATVEESRERERNVYIDSIKQSRESAVREFAENLKKRMDPVMNDSKSYRTGFVYQEVDVEVASFLSEGGSQSNVVSEKHVLLEQGSVKEGDE